MGGLSARGLPRRPLDRAIIALRSEYGNDAAEPAWLERQGKAVRLEHVRAVCPAHAITPGSRPLTLRERRGPGGSLILGCESGCLPSRISEALKELVKKWVDEDVDAGARRGTSRGPRGDAGRQLRFTAASTIRPERTRWLWRDRVPLGAVTLLAGKQGLGKSTLTVELAARLSRGELPGDLRGSRAGTLVVSYEDAPSSTISPRLRAAEADLARVHIVTAEVEGVPDLVALPVDLDELGRAARLHQARLLVVDPLVAALPAGELNAHRDQDVRRALAPLGQLAEEHDLAVVALIHFNKAQGTDAVARVSGSTGFTAAARSVLAFGADPEDPDGEEGPARVLAHAKSNLGPRAASVRCRLEGREIEGLDRSRIETSRLVVGNECETCASDLLAPVADRSRADAAADFLERELASGEWRPRLRSQGRR